MLEFATELFKFGLDLTSYTIQQMARLSEMKPRSTQAAPFTKPELLPLARIQIAPPHFETAPVSRQLHQESAPIDFAQAPGWGPMP